MTLDDLERPKRHNEDRPIVSAAKCRPTILVSGDIRYMRIFVAVPSGRGRQVQLSANFKHEF